MTLLGSVVLGPDVHTNRPAASVGVGVLYSCTTHSKVYRSNGTTWDDWAVLVGGAAVPAGGSAGQVLTKNSGTNYDTIWSTPSGGGGSSYPPGSADKKPTSPNAKDDEFDGTSSVTWTATPTAANAWDINSTRTDHAYLKASGTGAAYVGKYQAVPGAYPFTITAKLASTTSRANYHRGGGIILGPSAPTGTSNLVYVGPVWSTDRSFQRRAATFAGTDGGGTSGIFSGWYGHAYLRIKVNSATSIDTFVSFDGYAWVQIDTALNPGFTPAVMGVACSEEVALGGVEAYFDFFRIT